MKPKIFRLKNSTAAAGPLGSACRIFSLAFCFVSLHFVLFSTALRLPCPQVERSGIYGFYMAAETFPDTSNRNFNKLGACLELILLHSEVTLIISGQTLNFHMVVVPG